MLGNIRADIGRFRSCSYGDRLIYLFFEQGFWAVMIYRFGCWVRKIQIPIISFLLKVISFLLFKLTEIVTGISLPTSAQIGKGLYVGHFGPTILHSNTKMGENCSIGPGVIIGTKGQGNKGTPVIGNNVYIGAGSKILGSVKIGNNASIGANSVVIQSIPDGATAVGAPAKVIKIKSKGTV